MKNNTVRRIISAVLCICVLAVSAVFIVPPVSASAVDYDDSYGYVSDPEPAEGYEVITEGKRTDFDESFFDDLESEDGFYDSDIVDNRTETENNSDEEYDGLFDDDFIEDEYTEDDYTDDDYSEDDYCDDEYTEDVYYDDDSSISDEDAKEIIYLLQRIVELFEGLFDFFNFLY